MSFTLPATFPIVGLPLVAAFCLSGWQSSTAMKYRKAAGIKYPTLYATEAEANADPKVYKFNCAQRAHGNTLENIPYVLALFGYISIFHPVYASANMMIWIIGRVGYTTGYCTGNPQNRLNKLALTSYIGLLGLFLGAAYLSVSKTYAYYF
ncbi:hypothetical protein I317_04428 [Kwoniella heveanensis CBS 569]|uniref:Glutathione S-transferase n=1 Tax=Kwoniella heveanensis BCC8398 TaxID=1296120 RepID=A0A1B9GVC1_9TREE|nr:hypothetical protein I316_03521 [Kwoniella heveanensis BCC8398]OCF41724.1 hypothetical protein I317_04428 [Kwoniella heveanensis CBS 569]